MSLEKQCENNLNELKKSQYPGRGIVIGMTPDKKNIVQIYWIMGRSENSRNRIFILEDNGYVRTHPFDESKVKDPSLIIYYPIKYLNQTHIVTNGDQTDTIFDYLKKGKTFEDALNQRDFEPDSPNYTPRISGIANLSHSQYSYQLSVIKTLYNNPDCLVRHFYNYKNFIAGIGHCITTYIDDGNPLPSFTGEPVDLPVYQSIDENLDVYWNTLNKENIISLLVKFINIGTKQFEIKIKNKNL